MRVTITAANVPSEYGTIWPVGSTQTPLTVEYARNLVLTGRATDTDNYMAEPQNRPFIQSPLVLPGIYTFATLPTAAQMATRAVPTMAITSDQGLCEWNGQGWIGVIVSGAPQLTHWRQALAKVRAGTGRGRLLLLGDSTTVGAGAGSSGTTNLNGAWAKSRTQALTARLNALGVAASSNSITGDQAVSGSISYASYDPRVTLGANWAAGLANTLGGSLFYYSNGAANNFSFTPTAAFDTVTLYTVTNGGFGTCTVNVDGGASLGTINMAGSAVITATTYTVTAGMHTINIVPGNNGTLAICGIVTSLSTTPAIDVIQTGAYGAGISIFVPGSSPWDPQSMLATYAPNLTIIQLTINDSNNGTVLATYTSNLQTVVTAAKAVGDVIIESGIPSNTTQATNGTLAGFVAAAKSVAAASGCMFVDVGARFQNYNVANNLGWMYDNLHPTAMGYQDEAQFEATLLAFA